MDKVRTQTIYFEGFITLEHAADGSTLTDIIKNEITSDLESVWTNALVSVSSALYSTTFKLPTPSSEPSDRG